MRTHERTVTVTARAAGEALELVCPMPGLFRIAIAIGDLVRPGSVLGELEVLGQLVALVAPATARGTVTAICDRSFARPAVDFGTVLVTIDPRATTTATAAAAAQADATTGLVFPAPTSGRFYGRPTPDKPPFVVAGAELAPGATICLLEVMKTFHRVTYGGAGLPDRVRVTRVLVADGDDVNAGDPLLALDPVSA